MSYEIPAFLSSGNSDVLQLPALMPPPGISPNFVNPSNRGPILIVVNGILTGLMIVFVAIRVYTKSYIIRTASWDDLTVSLSVLGALWLYGIFVWEIEHGSLGIHQWNLHVSDMFSDHYLVTGYLTVVTSSPILWVTKITFFLLYIQIFWPLRWLRMSVYIGGTLTTAFYLGITVAQLVIATPRSGESWIQTFLAKRANGAVLLAIPISSIGLVVDILLLVLPSVAVYKLKLHAKKKIQLMLIFGTGFVAVLASALSVWFRYVTIHSYDFTWTLLNLDLMALVEIQVGVITACMPSFARMLHHHRPYWRQLRTRFTFSGLTSHTQALHYSASVSETETKPKDNKTRFGQAKNWFDSLKSFGKIETITTEKGGLKSLPHINTDDLSSSTTSVKGGHHGNMHTDGNHLQHDLEYTWTPITSG